jgi:hypothetical protein
LLNAGLFSLPGLLLVGIYKLEEQKKVVWFNIGRSPGGGNW